MRFNTVKNRFHAFLIHLACSTLIALLVVVIVFFVWYPNALATATGVTEIFFLVLAVDVSLGPLLTLAVFNVEKKELRRDLFIILLLQVGALFYGVYTVGVARPAYVVFAIDRFELVYANELTEEKLDLVSKDEYKTVSLWGPKWIAAQLPENISERNELLFSSVEGGDDLAQIPQYYLPYTESQDKVIEKLQPLEILKQFNASNLDGYNEIISRYSPDLSDYGYLPLQASQMDLVVVIDKATAEVLDIVELKPWG